MSITKRRRRHRRPNRGFFCGQVKNRRVLRRAVCKNRTSLLWREDDGKKREVVKPDDVRNLTEPTWESPQKEISPRLIFLFSFATAWYTSARRSRRKSERNARKKERYICRISRATHIYEMYAKNYRAKSDTLLFTIVYYLLLRNPFTRQRSVMRDREREKKPHCLSLSFSTSL